MALCSQAFNTSNKRSCNFDSDVGAVKRACMMSSVSKDNVGGRRVAMYSSSEEERDSEDEQSCYDADQAKARRRASTHRSFSTESRLSMAVSQYSDDEEACSEEVKKSENIDCRLSTTSGNRKCSQGSDSNVSVSVKRMIPQSDKDSRARCFDYLVGAIDEAWARYCDATSCVEEEVYGYATPASVATDDEDVFGNTTDLTDYEDDGVVEFGKTKLNAISYSNNSKKSISLINGFSSKDPSACQLSALKDRLTKAKYFLQDLVDSNDHVDANAFWKRWDMIKYATIELVEDDDDDDVVECTIEELELGRVFVN